MSHEALCTLADVGTVLGKCQLSLSCLLEVLEPEAASGGGSGQRKGIGKPVLLTRPGTPPALPAQPADLSSG